MVPVCVLGCDSNGYGVIRSIAKFNNSIPIVGIDYNYKAPALYSRYLNKKILITDPNKDEFKSFTDLIDLSNQFNEPPVVIITSDIFLSLFNKFRDALNKKFIFNIPSEKLLNIILDKGKQYREISKLSVDVPKTIFLSTSDKLDENFELQFPVFIKGAVPHIWKQHFIEKGFIAYNKSQLFKKISEIRGYKLDLVIQELIVGPNSNHFKVSAYYDKNGEPKLFFTTQKVRQFPFDFGVGSYMKSVRVDELLETGKRVFDALGYTGIGSIEFKKDERDGRFKFIELNPRMWQQNYQATLAGLNFAEYYYKDCIGEKTEFNSNFLENITYMDTVNDFQSFAVNKRITGETYFDWIEQLVKSNSYSFFNLADLRPILKSSNFGLKLFRYLKKLMMRGYS